jgi:hypothetical protein
MALFPGMFHSVPQRFAAALEGLRMHNLLNETSQYLSFSGKEEQTSLHEKPRLDSLK